MPNIFDQFDTPTPTIAPDGRNPFDAFGGNVFDQFDEPAPLKFANLPGNIKSNPLQQVQMQSLLADKGIDPENSGATLANVLRGNDDVFLSSVAPPIATAGHALTDNPLTRGIGFGLNFAGQAIKGDVEAALFSMLGQKQLANQELIATAGNMNPAWKQKDESLGIDTSDPYEDARETLPIAERMASGVGPGLIQTAPQLALAALQPELGAASFGFTPQGFDPVQATAAVIAPGAGKMIGGIAEKLAAKAGLSNEQALNVINRLGGSTGVASLISAPTAYQIAQMEPGKERDAAIQDAASNAIVTAALGSMSGHGESSEIDNKAHGSTALEDLTPNGTETSQRLDDLAARIKNLEGALRANQLKPPAESSEPAPIKTADDEYADEQPNQHATVSSPPISRQIFQSRLGTADDVPPLTTTSDPSKPFYFYSEDGTGGLGDQTTQIGVQDYLRRQNNVPPVQIVNDPNWTHNGYGVRGTVQEGKIVVNQAFIDNYDTLQNVLREEHNHLLLSSGEGRQAIRDALGNKLGIAQLASLSAKYPILPGESVPDYRLRLTDEFIAKAASKQLPIWQQIVERVKGWLADKGIGELSDEETARAIVRSLKAGKSATLAAPFGALESAGENSGPASRYNLIGEPLQGMGKAIWGARLHDIWIEPEVQNAWRYVHSNLTTKGIEAAFNRRKAQGLPPDPSAVREEAATERVTNPDRRDRIAENFHNAIRAAFERKFRLDLPATAHPLLKEAVNQFLREHVMQGTSVAGAAAENAAKFGSPSKIRTIRGRKPINSKYAGRTHPSGVKFTYQGFPDFSPYAIAQYIIDGLTGIYEIDEAKANEKAGLKATPDGYVWHHVEDGKTMQLIPKKIHRQTRHTGGAALIRNGGFDNENENQINRRKSGSSGGRKKTRRKNKVPDI